MEILSLIFNYKLGKTWHYYKTKAQECNVSCYEVHAKFPTLAPTYEKVRNIKILHSVEKVVKSNKICRGACEELTQNI